MRESKGMISTKKKKLLRKNDSEMPYKNGEMAVKKIIRRMEHPREHQLNQ